MMVRREAGASPGCGIPLAPVAPITAPECARDSSVAPPGYLGERACCANVSNLSAGSKPCPQIIESPIETILKATIPPYFGSIIQLRPRGPDIARDPHFFADARRRK